MCIHMGDSLRCTAETSTTLWSNYTPIKKIDYSKEAIQMANMHRKGGSPSLVIREMQMKTTVTYHFRQTRMVKIKKTDNNKC